MCIILYWVVIFRDRNFEKIGIGFGKKFVKIGRPGIPGIEPGFTTDFQPDQK
jgi:hypothetical protein